MMRRRRVLVFLAGAAALSSAGPLAVPAAGAWAVPAARGAVPAGALRAAASFGRAIDVPGLRALNKGGNAGVSSVSCVSAGNCAAGGRYQSQGQQGFQGFVAGERNGRWGRAVKVAGPVSSVSCASAGNCAAGGVYRARHQNQGFVAVERHGVWARGIEVPGLGALNKGGNAAVSSVSCGSAGNCAAVGYYQDQRRQGFAVVEKNGRWGQAIEVPGLEALKQYGDAWAGSVSCGSAGNCAAGGSYRNHGRQGFVVLEKNGVWGQAIEVPGLGALNKGGSAQVYAVSCPAAGYCAAGGGYSDGGQQGFVTSEKNGVWGQAIEVPGLGALNAGDGGQDAFVGSVSCASAGNCAAGGSVGGTYPLGFVASEKNGVWGQAIAIVIALGSIRYANVYSVSCASAGNCVAGGGYLDTDTGSQGFVAVQRSGRWGQAVKVPGLAALNKGGNAGVRSVSCAPAGNCTAGGTYKGRGGQQQGFVTLNNSPRRAAGLLLHAGRPQ